MLGLSSGALAYAVGIAASRAGSLFANAGTMTKCTHCGHAASRPVWKQRCWRPFGFTANPDIIEARDGYADAFLAEGLRRVKAA